jgi:hypothetical protein
MTNPGLLSERLTVLPPRLETIAFSGAHGIHHDSVVGQVNVNTQIGGDCLLSGCVQTNVQINVAPVISIQPIPWRSGQG